MAAKMGRCTFAVLLGIVCFSYLAKGEELSNVVTETQKGLAANATKYKDVTDEEIDALLNDSSEIFPAGSESNFDIEDEFILVPKTNKSIEGSISQEVNTGTSVQLSEKSELTNLNESSTDTYDTTSVVENIKLTTKKRSTMQEYSYTNSDATMIVETNSSSTAFNQTLETKVVTLAQSTVSVPSTSVPAQIINTSMEQSHSSSSSEARHPTRTAVDSVNVTSAEGTEIIILDNSTITTAADTLRITDSSSVESTNSSEIIEQTTVSVRSIDPSVDPVIEVTSDNTNVSTTTTAPGTSRDSSSVDSSNSSETIDQTTATVGSTDPTVVPTNETTVDNLDVSTITTLHDTSTVTNSTDVEESNTSKSESTDSTTESFNSTETEYITGAESTTSNSPDNLRTETDPVTTQPTDVSTFERGISQSKETVEDLDPTRSTPGHSSVKLAISVTFLLIASIAAIVLIIYMVRMRRRTILYDELRLLP